MLRTAVTPRWLGWLVAVLVASAGFVWLGLWQMNVAREDAAQEVLQQAAARPVSQLTEVIGPHAAFPRDGSNQRVSAVGRWEPDRQFLVTDRRLAGADGYWVVQPFVVEATGARIPVVLGFVRSVPAGEAIRARAVAAGAAGRAGFTGSAGGTLTLVGSLAPTESPPTGRREYAAGQAGSVELGSLLNLWGGEVYNAFLFAVSETPDPGLAGPTGSSATGAMERVPPPDLPSGITLRNAAYALQWWIFAVFALWMWVKMVRDDYRRHQPAADAGTGQSLDGGAPQ